MFSAPPTALLNIMLSDSSAFLTTFGHWTQTLLDLNANIYFVALTQS